MNTRPKPPPWVRSVQKEPKKTLTQQTLNSFILRKRVADDIEEASDSSSDDCIVQFTSPPQSTRHTPPNCRTKKAKSAQAETTLAPPKQACVATQLQATPPKPHQDQPTEPTTLPSTPLPASRPGRFVSASMLLTIEKDNEEFDDPWFEPPSWEPECDSVAIQPKITPPQYPTTTTQRSPQPQLIQQPPTQPLLVQPQPAQPQLFQPHPVQLQPVQPQHFQPPPAQPQPFQPQLVQPQPVQPPLAQSHKQAQLESQPRAKRESLEIFADVSTFSEQFQIHDAESNTLLCAGPAIAIPRTPDQIARNDMVVFSHKFQLPVGHGCGVVFVSLWVDLHHEQTSNQPPPNPVILSCLVVDETKSPGGHEKHGNWSFERCGDEVLISFRTESFDMQEPDYSVFELQCVSLLVNARVWALLNVHSASCGKDTLLHELEVLGALCDRLFSETTNSALALLTTLAQSLFATTNLARERLEQQHTALLSRDDLDALRLCGSVLKTALKPVSPFPEIDTSEVEKAVAEFSALRQKFHRQRRQRVVPSKPQENQAIERVNSLSVAAMTALKIPEPDISQTGGPLDGLDTLWECAAFVDGCNLTAHTVIPLRTWLDLLPQPAADPLQLSPSAQSDQPPENPQPPSFSAIGAPPDCSPRIFGACPSPVFLLPSDSEHSPQDQNNEDSQQLLVPPATQHRPAEPECAPVNSHQANQQQPALPSPSHQQSSLRLGSPNPLVSRLSLRRKTNTVIQTGSDSVCQPSAPLQSDSSRPVLQQSMPFESASTPTLQTPSPPPPLPIQPPRVSTQPTQSQAAPSQLTITTQFAEATTRHTREHEIVLICSQDDPCAQQMTQSQPPPPATRKRQRPRSVVVDDESSGDDVQTHTHTSRNTCTSNQKSNAHASSRGSRIIESDSDSPQPATLKRLTLRRVAPPVQNTANSHSHPHQLEVVDLLSSDEDTKNYRGGGDDHDDDENDDTDDFDDDDDDDPHVCSTRQQPRRVQKVGYIDFDDSEEEDDTASGNDAPATQTQSQAPPSTQPQYSNFVRIRPEDATWLKPKAPASRARGSSRNNGHGDSRNDNRDKSRGDNRSKYRFSRRSKGKKAFWRTQSLDDGQYRRYSVNNGKRTYYKVHKKTT